MLLLIDLMMTRQGTRDIFTSVEPGNELAAGQWGQPGFEDSGEKGNGEALLGPDLSDNCTA